MPALSSSPIPTALTKLGPLDEHTIADLHPYLDTVPDPRSRHGRWYPLTCLLLICASAALSGARNIEESAEWGQRAPGHTLHTIGVRPHLLAWRRAPTAPTLERVLARIDTQALDAAIGSYLARCHHNATSTDPAAPARLPAICVDGKTLKGSGRPGRPQRHLLSAVTHHPGPDRGRGQNQ